MAKILLVDDRPKTLEAIKIVIEDNIVDVEILTAYSEAEAISIINNTEGIDVVVSDLIMDSNESGINVLNAAKEKDKLMMVIITTAFPEKLDKKLAFENGLFDFVEKGNFNLKSADVIVHKIKNTLKFRQLALEIIDSNKKMTLFERYFDPLIFKKIQNNPTLLDPVIKTITIVFWDIRGFSALCEILKPQPLLISFFLKEYFEAATRIISKHGGILDKFIGDGVMAIFGAFSDNMEDNKDGEQDAKAATNAALDLRREFQAIYKKAEKKWSLFTGETIDIGLGCGIHTGEVLVGNLGTSMRDHFTAVGPHVNLAARIEGTALRGQIRLSRTTRARIDSDFKVETVEVLTNIKNITGSYEIYEIIE